MKPFEENKESKQSNFSVIASLIIFIFSTIMFLIGQFTPDALYSFGVLYPIFMFLTIGIVIYVLKTYRKRRTIDYVVTTILFVAVLTITIQNFIYFYRPRTGNFYYSLNYKFPGILKYNTYWLVSVDPLKYELENTKVLFDPTLISSFACLSISLIAKKVKK